MVFPFLQGLWLRANFMEFKRLSQLIYRLLLGWVVSRGNRPHDKTVSECDALSYGWSQ
jgi:hypothetical protein